VATLCHRGPGGIKGGGGWGLFTIGTVLLNRTALVAGALTAIQGERKRKRKGKRALNAPCPHSPFAFTESRRAHKISSTYTDLCSPLPLSPSSCCNKASERSNLAGATPWPGDGADAGECGGVSPACPSLSFFAEKAAGECAGEAGDLRGLASGPVASPSLDEALVTCGDAVIKP
jgi:hypothetical protein